MSILKEIYEYNASLLKYRVERVDEEERREQEERDGQSNDSDYEEEEKLITFAQNKRKSYQVQRRNSAMHKFVVLGQSQKKS
jgi:hypothetical protein